MSNINATMVKELREKTGAGIMDCKEALKENNGDVEQAAGWLRQKGISKADKKAAQPAVPRYPNLPWLEYRR